PPPALEALALAYLESGQGASLLARRIVASRLNALAAHKPSSRPLSTEERRALAKEVRAGLEGLRTEYLEELARAREAQKDKRERTGRQTDSATDPPPLDRMDAFSALAFASAAIHRAASAVVGAWGRLTGSPRWRWRTRGDDRVRPSHRRLEGKVFKIGEGDPQEGQAGDAWGCRCWMEPL
ncbi:MAG: hypothetical protein E6Q97_32140, partial [Desulfurellales bacterium]